MEEDRLQIQTPFGYVFGQDYVKEDVSELKTMAEQQSIDPFMLQAIESRNVAQKQYLFEKLKQHLQDLSGRRLAIWGLSFKPKTDDTRFAPSIDMIEKLISKGAIIQAYDPIGSLKHIFKRNYKEYNSAIKALKNSSALLICTEWKEFWSLDLKNFNKYMKESCIFDGRNIYSPPKLAAYGIKAKFDRDALQIIADRAANEKTGARGLLTVCERVLRNFKFELPGTSVTELSIDENLLNNTSEVLEKY